MRASQLLEAFFVKLTILPKRIQLIVHLLGIEFRQLFAQTLKSQGRLDMRHKIEYMYLCRTKCDGFHNLLFLLAAKIQQIFIIRHLS